MARNFLVLQELPGSILGILKSSPIQGTLDKKVETFFWKFVLMSRQFNQTGQTQIIKALCLYDLGLTSNLECSYLILALFQKTTIHDFQIPEGNKGLPTVQQQHTWGCKNPGSGKNYNILERKKRLSHVQSCEGKLVAPSLINWTFLLD